MHALHHVPRATRLLANSLLDSATTLVYNLCRCNPWSGTGKPCELGNMTDNVSVRDHARMSYMTLTLQRIRLPATRHSWRT
jgi:hypothetical protein